MNIAQTEIWKTKPQVGLLTWCKPVLIMWNWSTSFLCRGRISGCTSFSWTASPTPRMCTCWQEISGEKALKRMFAPLSWVSLTSSYTYDEIQSWVWPVPASNPSDVWFSLCLLGDCWCSPYQRRPVVEEKSKDEELSRFNPYIKIDKSTHSFLSTSWYLAMPPFTAASMTPFRHMLSGLMLPWCCLCWYWLIRVRSSWVLFSTT